MKPITRNLASAPYATLALLASLALVPPTSAASPAASDAAARSTNNHATPDHVHTAAGTEAPAGEHGSADVPSADGRKLINVPPQMRMHMLSNMRDHVATLDGILHALAAGNYHDASELASERLGLDSPSGAACKPKAANASATTHGSMDEMMALYMPEQMRAIGLAMHTSASEFAAVASREASTRDAKAAVEALSRVTENCVSCHSSYRLQ
jgi:hypothetical protein